MENKELERKEKISIGKIIILLFFISIIGFGIFGSLCGGFFIFSSFYEYLINSRTTYLEVILVISIPSLILGLSFIVTGYKTLKENELYLKIIEKVKNKFNNK